MPKLTIDGRELVVPDGRTVIQAAEENGIWIPRYCYHPGLSIAGNCRICLVEVERLPKLQIACNTIALEGMVVHTQSERAQDGRRAVLEFLLANHPLDCPVCDQSGECDLQDFYMNFGLYDPRFREHKVKKKKAIALGPHVILDQERCILCSRCVRFADEITETSEFGIFQRGDRAWLGLHPDARLDNAYSANVVDICPVGALTERDFRFKVRVWYLSRAPSVCNGCSRGCNIDVDFVLDRPHLNDGARLVRVKPRPNPDVNQWWMCDAGRYGLGWVDRGRLTAVRGPDVASADEVALGDGHGRGWDEALSALAASLSALRDQGHASRSAVIASVEQTNEELFLMRELLGRWLGARLTAEVPWRPGPSDDFLVQADKHPNRSGATLLGLAGADATPLEEIVEAALGGDIDVLWVCGHDLVELLGEETVRRLSEALSLFVYSGTNENATAALAHWVLPTAAYLERDGTFVNCEGRVQRIGRVLPALQGARADWRVLLDLAWKLGRPLDWKDPQGIFRALAEAEAPFAGLDYESIAGHGAPIASGSAAGAGRP